jgi:hypothetical protein
VSHLKAAGWSDVRIRDEYTKHKHLSTLQDKYMSYVPERITEEDLWKMIPVGTGDTGSSPENDTEITDVVDRYGL